VALVVDVGPLQAWTTLTSALQSFQQFSSSLLTPDEVVLKLTSDVELHPQTFFSLPSNITRLVIEGAGDFGWTRVLLPTGTTTSPIELGAGVQVEYRNVRFLLLDGRPPSVFLQQRGNSCLSFQNCLASSPATSEPSDPYEQLLVDTVQSLLGTQIPNTQPIAFARLTGALDRLVADGLKVGFGFSIGVEAVGGLVGGGTPRVSLTHSGFREVDIGVSLRNIGLAKAKATRFSGCGTGLLVQFDYGARSGGLLEFADCRFHDCARGAVVYDEARLDGSGSGFTSRAGLACNSETRLPGAPGRRLIRFLRNEFRAPDVARYPDAPGLVASSDGVRPGEAVGLLASFAPRAAPQSARFPPQLLVQNNVFHLLDHGISIAVGQHGQAVIDHNTFVANHIRAICVVEVAPSATRWLGLVVTRNLVQSVQERPWLGLREEFIPSGLVSARYRHGGVEFLQALSPSSAWTRAWIVSNLFCDFGPRPYVAHVQPASAGPQGVETIVATPWWDSIVTNGPGGVTTWGNEGVDDPGEARLLRLPRVRRVQGDALTMVEFDYHATMGTEAAPADSQPSSLGFDSGWLEDQDVELSTPALDYHGEVWNFHPQSSGVVGACRERRAAQGWPLISWGGNLSQRTRLVDGVMVGRVYVHRNGPQGQLDVASLGLNELEESFSSGVSLFVRNWIDQSPAADGGVIVPLPIYSGGDCGDHDGSYSDGSCVVRIEWVPVFDANGLQTGVRPTRRIWVADALGPLELPIKERCDWSSGAVPNPYCSFDNGDWPARFVDYYLARLQRYVELVVAYDSENRIMGWVLGDEMPNQPSIQEFMARAREVIESEDPLRRPVYTGFQSTASLPHWGGIASTAGASSLDFDDTKPPEDRYWRPPVWSETKGSLLFLGREGRSYRGSLPSGAARFAASRACLEPAPSGVQQ